MYKIKYNHVYVYKRWMSKSPNFYIIQPTVQVSKDNNLIPLP